MTALWAGFFAIVAVLLALDLGVFRRSARAVGAKEALRWTALWITVGTSFTGVVYLVFESGYGGATLLGAGGAPLPAGGHGGVAATRYLTAYLLEKSLSVDNIFVIALVFQQFGVPEEHRHRVLFWGVLGAIVMRGGMLLGGLWLLHRFSWLFYVFGAYLVFTGLKLFKGGGDEEAENPGGFVERLRRFLRCAPPGVGEPGSFVTRYEGRRALTTLGLSLIVIEWTDLVFALDSIPAVLAVAPEPFIVFTSNIFAIMGLRSLYFVLENAVKEFHELQYALAVILTFIGGKMLIHDLFHVPNGASLAVIVLALTVAITLGLSRRRLERREAEALARRDAPPESG
ncbi:MAG: TerC/Alx family metal homeostasis membrane protein [Myxococcota bacterium]